jgi:hypothetical protein
MLKKVLIKAAMAATFAGASLLSLQATGSIANGYELEYYSDASYTDVVGSFIFECNMDRTLTGTKTAYAREVMRWRC